jgi:hypothetical protein
VFQRVYHGGMKQLTVLLAACASMMAGDLASVKTVYILRMPNGLDQYLAIQLAHDGPFKVVTDPQKADVIFTDRIGANFEQEMRNLFAPPKADGKLGDADPNKAVMQPLSHGKGSIFLVDRTSKEVLWSLYVKPTGTGSDYTHQLAGKIISALNKSRKEEITPPKTQIAPTPAPAPVAPAAPTK